MVGATSNATARFFVIFCGFYGRARAPV